MSSPHFHHIHGKWWKTTLVQALPPSLGHERRRGSKHKPGKLFPACFYSLQCKLMGKNKFSTASASHGEEKHSNKNKKKSRAWEKTFRVIFLSLFLCPDDAALMISMWNISEGNISLHFYLLILSVCMNVWMFMLSHYSNTSSETSWRQIRFEVLEVFVGWFWKPGCFSLKGICRHDLEVLLRTSLS